MDWESAVHRPDGGLCLVLGAVLLAIYLVMMIAVYGIRLFCPEE